MGLKTPDHSRARWTFLSNHGNVLLVIARHPDATLREVAELVGLSERAVQRIVADLEAGQYLERTRTGRRNRYQVHPELPLRHPITAHRDLGSLIELVTDPVASNGVPR
jgi:DNA-binding IclR family transcriptional regulator